MGANKKPPVRQSLRCKGCIWGKWEASAQFCSKPIVCVKPDGGVKK
ncbi:hypothetical protein JCM16418A_29210 [Paenibacillus pini]